MKFFKRALDKWAFRILALIAIILLIIFGINWFGGCGGGKGDGDNTGGQYSGDDGSGNRPDGTSDPGSSNVNDPNANESTNNTPAPSVVVSFVEEHPDTEFGVVLSIDLRLGTQTTRISGWETDAQGNLIPRGFSPQMLNHMESTIQTYIDSASGALQEITVVRHPGLDAEGFSTILSRLEPLATEVKATNTLGD